MLHASGAKFLLRGEGTQIRRPTGAFLSSARRSGIQIALMNCRIAVLLMLFAGLPSLATVAGAQAAPAAQAKNTSAADGQRNPNEAGPALTGVRHPLYRLHKNDVVEVKFTFSPEFDQTVTVQPDGYVALKGLGELLAEGLTVSELRDALRDAYAPVLRDPEVSVILTGFEKPYFVAAGQVARPGKYDLRSPTGIVAAIAIAGGFNDQARHSQVVLFRPIADGVVESHVLNIKAMLASRNLEEDIELKPGGMLFVPQNRISKIRRYFPTSSLSTFFTPAQF
jgi:polysaccharide export outer membrane protein